MRLSAKFTRKWQLFAHSRREIDMSEHTNSEIADAAIAALLAELDTPSEGMVNAAIKAAEDADGTFNDGITAAIQAIAAHLKGRT